MSHSISLTAEDRKTLLGYYRGRHDPQGLRRVIG